MIQQSIFYYQKAVLKLQQLDFIPLLLLRLYLTPVMMQAGWTKLQNFDSTLSWFADPDWGLGLPAPALLLSLVILLELGGGFALLFLQRLFGFLQLHQHQPCVVTKHASGLGRADGAGVAVEQLLVQCLLHQLDLPRDRGGRHAFAAGHFGKAAVVEDRYKQP